MNQPTASAVTLGGVDTYPPQLLAASPATGDAGLASGSEHEPRAPFSGTTSWKAEGTSLIN